MIKTTAFVKSKSKFETWKKKWERLLSSELLDVCDFISEIFQQNEEQQKEISDLKKSIETLQEQVDKMRKNWPKGTPRYK